MADELRPDRKLARHRGALLAGQKPRRLVALAVTGARVAPRASRPSRGMQNCLQLRDGRRRIPRAGYRDCSLRSPVPRKGRSAR